MEITLDLIVFTVLAVFTLASAVLAVKKLRRMEKNIGFPFYDE